MITKGVARIFLYLSERSRIVRELAIECVLEKANSDALIAGRSKSSRKKEKSPEFRIGQMIFVGSPALA